MRSVYLLIAFIGYWGIVVGDDDPTIGWMGLFGTLKSLNDKQKTDQNMIVEKAKEELNRRFSHLHDFDITNSTVEIQELYYKTYVPSWGEPVGRIVTSQRPICANYLVTLQTKHSLKDASGTPFFQQHILNIFRSPGSYHITKHVHYDIELDIPENKQKTVYSQDDTDTDINNPINFKTASPKSTESKEPSSATYPFKIVSYNIWNTNGDWKDRLETIAKQITKLSPDIIMFQEVRFVFEKNVEFYGSPRVEIHHQIVELVAKLKEYQYVYQPAMTYLQMSNTMYSHVDEGVAILSKFSILETSHIKLTRNFIDREDEHQRIVLRALINTTTGPVNFFTTHLTLSNSARRRNIIELWKWMEEFDKEVPQIITGDFNANPDSEALKFLVGNLELDGITGNLKDAWISTGLDDLAGWTYTTLEEEPKKRIDFILYRGKLDVQNIYVLSNEDLMTQPSDHRALVATFVKRHQVDSQDRPVIW